MDFSSGLFPGTMVWGANLALAATLWWALRSAPWARLRDPEQLHVYLGGCVVLLLLWTLRAGILPGLNFHFLGVTALTLMFGWELTLIGVSGVVIGITLNAGAGWDVVGLNVLSMGGIPIVVTCGLLRLARCRLPLNFFVFVFINAFLAAGLSNVLVGLVTALLMLGSGVYDLEALSYGYLAYLPLMLFPEGVINGSLISIFVAYRPHWVASFDDALYLRSG